MINVTFIEHDGTKHKVSAKAGQSVMQAATFNQVPGITADCGGACACATCHAYVTAEWVNSFPEKTEIETDLLECALDVRESSRLSCQLGLTDAADGIVIELPESQKI